jgi:hypothetical protein
MPSLVTWQAVVVSRVVARPASGRVVCGATQRLILKPIFSGAPSRLPPLSANNKRDFTHASAGIVSSILALAWSSLLPLALVWSTHYEEREDQTAP